MPTPGPAVSHRVCLTGLISWFTWDSTRTGRLSCRFSGPSSAGELLSSSMLVLDWFHRTFSASFVLGLRFRLDAALNLQEVVDVCPAQVSGADLYALCSDAMAAAVKRKISLIGEGEKSQSKVSFC